MVMPADVAATLKVVETYLAFQVLIVALDDPPRLGQEHQTAQARSARHGGEPELARLGFALGPFD
jgi:hypothetical protein